MNAELAIVLLVPAAETLPTAEYTAAEFIIVILAVVMPTEPALAILMVLALAHQVHVAGLTANAPATVMAAVAHAVLLV